MVENSALVAGLVRLVEEWRSLAALASNQVAANIIEECAAGVDDVIDAALASYGPDKESGYEGTGVEAI